MSNSLTPSLTSTYFLSSPSPQVLSQHKFFVLRLVPSFSYFLSFFSHPEERKKSIYPGFHSSSFLIWLTSLFLSLFLSLSLFLLLLLEKSVKYEERERKMFRFSILVLLLFLFRIFLLLLCILLSLLLLVFVESFLEIPQLKISDSAVSLKATRAPWLPRRKSRSCLMS